MEGNALQASSRFAFRQRYVQRFLPLLLCVREKSAMKRFQAVKTAADFSLACTAGKTSWSKALCRRLSMRRQRARKQKRIVGSSIASEAGLVYLKHLRKRRMWARARARVQPAVNYRRSYLQAQRKHSKDSMQATQYGKPEGRQGAKRPNVITRYGNFEAAKLSSLSELIPGGLNMDIPKLLDQTAHYIVSLQLQVDALSFLGQALSA